MPLEFPQPADNVTRRNVLLGLAAVGGAFYAGHAGAETPHRWPLFTVEGKGGRVYLMGEVPPRPTVWHDSRIEALVPRCSMVWTETNNIFKSKVQDLIARYGTDETAPLERRISEADRARLVKAAELAHVSLDDLANFRPFMAGTILEGSYYDAMGMADAADKILVAKAKSAGVGVSSEFAVKDDVIEWFAAMTPDQDIQFLRYTLDEVLAGPAEDERIFGAWSRGDAGPATSRLAEMKRDYPELFPKLVVERNIAWIPRFKKMLTDKKPVLVITGLYHLVGRDSLLVRLRAAGMTVRSV
jgi:uncharacterized protein YbaP (TraB family)